MTVTAKFTEFGADGLPIGGGQMQFPSYLDWMPIQVKAHFYLHIGQGNPNTKSVLLVSQGQQLLIKEPTLATLDYKAFKEKYDGAEAEVDRFSRDGGYSRTPRNQ